MYLLALAFLAASAYSFWIGELENARLILGIGLVLAGARFVLGPQEEASLPRKVGLGIGVLVLIAAVSYAIRCLFG